jgi:hypothetical protein
VGGEYRYVTGQYQVVMNRRSTWITTKGTRGMSNLPGVGTGDISKPGRIASTLGQKISRKQSTKGRIKRVGRDCGDGKE